MRWMSASGGEEETKENPAQRAERLCVCLPINNRTTAVHKGQECREQIDRQLHCSLQQRLEGGREPLSSQDQSKHVTHAPNVLGAGADTASILLVLPHKANKSGKSGTTGD